MGYNGPAPTLRTGAPMPLPDLRGYAVKVNAAKWVAKPVEPQKTIIEFHDCSRCSIHGEANVVSMDHAAAVAVREFSNQSRGLVAYDAQLKSMELVANRLPRFTVSALFKRCTHADNPIHARYCRHCGNLVSVAMSNTGSVTHSWAAD